MLRLQMTLSTAASKDEVSSCVRRRGLHDARHCAASTAMSEVWGYRCGDQPFQVIGFRHRRRHSIVDAFTSGVTSPRYWISCPPIGGIGAEPVRNRISLNTRGRAVRNRVGCAGSPAAEWLSEARLRELAAPVVVLIDCRSQNGSSIAQTPCRPLSLLDSDHQQRRSGCG